MPVPNNVRSQIRGSARIKDGAESALIEGIETIENRVLQLVMQHIGGMSGSGGGVRDSKANQRRLIRLKKAVRDEIKKQLRPKHQDYLRAFLDLDASTIKTFKLIGEEVPASLIQPTRQAAFEQLEAMLQGSELEAGVINPLLNRVQRLVLTGADFGDMQAELSRAIGIGKYLNRGITNGAIPVDVINQYHGAINKKIGQELGYTWLVYTGSIIETSRPQCRRWVTKLYIHESELQEEINWAFANGSGMINPTTPSTFAANRGGHRCRHDSIYIPDHMVPEERRLSIV